MLNNPLTSSDLHQKEKQRCHMEYNYMIFFYLHVPVCTRILLDTASKYWTLLVLYRSTFYHFHNIGQLEWLWELLFNIFTKRQASLKYYLKRILDTICWQSYECIAIYCRKCTFLAVKHYYFEPYIMITCTTLRGV